MPTVRYIGPDAAILAGSYLYEGETRDVTPAQLAVAQRDHPQGFVIVGGAGVGSVIASDADPPMPAPADDLAATPTAPASVTTPGVAVPPRQPLPPQRPDHGRQPERRR